MKKIITAIIFIFCFANLQAQVDIDSLFQRGKEFLDNISKFSELTDEEEMEFGSKLAENYDNSLSSNSEFQKRVNTIGDKIIQNVSRTSIKYTFRVIDDGEEINAYSLAGGNIYVTTGLMNLIETDDELAFIIGHEVAHEDKKHTMKKVQLAYKAYKYGGETAQEITSIIQNYITLPFAKYQEYEADEYGVQLSMKAGYSGKGAINIFKKFMNYEDTGKNGLEYIFSSHPPTADRIKKIQKIIN